jgi:hypothetical protein
MKLLIMQFSPTSCLFTPLWSKYSPQHPQSTFLPYIYIYRARERFGTLPIFHFRTVHNRKNKGPIASSRLYYSYTWVRADGVRPTTVSL